MHLRKRTKSQCHAARSYRQANKLMWILHNGICKLSNFQVNIACFSSKSDKVGLLDSNYTISTTKKKKKKRTAIWTFNYLRKLLTCLPLSCFESFFMCCNGFLLFALLSLLHFVVPPSIGMRRKSKVHLNLKIRN